MTKLSELTPDLKNANRHTKRGDWMLEEAVGKHGSREAGTLDKHGSIVGGNLRQEIYGRLGLDEIQIVKADPKIPVFLQFDDLDLEDPANPAREIGLALNRIAQVSIDFDPDVLAALAGQGVPLEEMWSEKELDAMGVMNGSVKEPDNIQPNPRDLPIDVIYTLQGADATCCLAVRAGLMYGIQSPHSTICPYCIRGDANHKVAFIDNDYYQYNHQAHLKMVKEHLPKYATVRDIMDKQQCATDGIVYYSFEQIMDWASELSEYAENVIVIPKYDCLDKIPEKYMLGYSVPTSHGGTPLPVEIFKGRRVHLLGGSWKKQLNYMAALEDDIVSLDNNYVHKMASEYGSYVMPDGETMNLTKVGHGILTNPRYVALSLSFGNMGAKVNELYNKKDDDGISTTKKQNN